MLLTLLQKGLTSLGSSLGGTWVTRFLSDLSSTVFQVRAIAQTKPQRRAESAVSRSWTIRMFALEPEAASPPTITSFAQRGGTNAPTISRNKAFALRYAAWRLGRMMRKPTG